MSKKRRNDVESDGDPTVRPVAGLGWPPAGPTFRIFFVLLLVLFLHQVLRPLLAPTVLAAAVAVVIAPLRRKLERRFGAHSNRAALISLLLFTLFAGAPLLGAALLFVAQARVVLEDFIGMPAGDALTTGFSRLVDQYLEWMEQLGDRYFGTAVDVRQIAEARLRDMGTHLSGSLPDILEWVSRLVLGFVVFNVVLYFLLRDGGQILGLLRQLSPLERRHTEQILSRLAGIVRAVFLGGVLTALFQATIGAFGFLITGFESFVIWGVFLFVASFVPVLGTALVWAPAVLYLALTDGLGKALLLLGVGIVISTTDNLLRIVLIGRQTTLHPLVLFVAVFGGLATGGPMGLIYGILLAAALTEAIEIYRSEMRPVAEPEPAS